ncbi:MAG: hypothetical protein H0V74_05380, partial [Chloroflexi bacterium]|nr:hypothetical protein [Chloroflexota bacterium]
MGGTLRVGLIGDDWASARQALFGDPARGAILTGPFHLGRCCLLRTLMAYPGQPTSEGGTVIHPDLARDHPTISRDGLTWTFRLRPGVHYAAPFDKQEIVAGDIVRGAERNLRIDPDLALVDAGNVGPFGFVRGASEFGAGTSPSISGLETPDKDTLVVRLTEPYGAFAHLVTDVAWAPLPEGAADGHDTDYPNHIASSGPYMYESPGDPAAQPLVLVRNPAWDRATDPIRGAWLDRIEISFAGDQTRLADAVARVKTGELDTLGTFFGMPRSVVEQWRSDPALARRLVSAAGESLFWIPMNLAVPPFDDVAVRRAVNAVIDRAAVRDLILAQRDERLGVENTSGAIARHVFPDSVTAGLLTDYAPFPSLGDHGDVARARAEMATSRYDTDGDGMCDAPQCVGPILSTMDPVAGQSVADSLSLLGITATVVPWDEKTDIGMVKNRTAIQVQTFGWVYALHGSDLAGLVQGGPNLADADGFTLNSSLVGASDEQLRSWGYAV